MNPRYSFLALNALKFFRKIIGLKDEFYNRYIIKFDLMSYIVDAFIKNGTRQNMLNSAVLEMFEFIKIEDIKTLIKYTCERHIHKLLELEPCPTFNAIKTKYEQQLERQNNTTTNIGSLGVIKMSFETRFRRDPRDLDEDEENYFNSDDDLPEKDISSKPLYNLPVVVQSKVLDSKPPPNKVIGSPLATSPLVDYADDSDEDESDSTIQDKQPSSKRQKVTSTVT